MSETSKNPFGPVLEEIRQIVRQELQEAMKGQSAPARRRDQGGERRYLTVEEAAEVSSLAPSTIRLYIRKGRLKALKVGRRVVIPTTELERFLSVKPIGVALH